ncbi:sugar transferase, partial [Chloroflexota bacterium]
LQVLSSSTVFSWFIFLGALYLTYRDISRLQILYVLAIYLPFLWIFRITLRIFFTVNDHHRYRRRRVLIVGQSPSGQEIAHLLEKHRWNGLECAGFIIPQPENQDQVEDWPVLGGMADVTAVVERWDIEEVVIALERDNTFNLQAFVYTLQNLAVSIRLIPDYFDLAFLQLQVEVFGGVPLLSLREPVLTPYQRFIKRIFDIIVTTLILIPGLPIMAIISLLIKLDDGGPILFKQQRYGEGGKLFMMLKFRTMIPDAETLQTNMAQKNEDGFIIYKHHDDPRITRIGKWLRRASLDELPQFFNILRGDMSLVGPRPELPQIVGKYKPWQRKRFEVPQGLTGWWQINGRSNKPMHLSTEDDLYYIRNYSLWLDLKIMFRTIFVVLSRKGAF